MLADWCETLAEQEMSPYEGLDEDLWIHKARDLVDRHPLNMNELVQVVIDCWEGILDTRLGTGRYQIGHDIFPTPQIMAFLLHELIPLELARRHPGTWRRDNSSDEKDVVYTPDDRYSFEIKASSSRTGIFANRSYAQPSPNAKKHKAGYYLAVNFEKFEGMHIKPRITWIRMGWLDHTDWIAQRSATGQQARLDIRARDNKLLQLYRASD